MDRNIIENWNFWSVWKTWLRHCVKYHHQQHMTLVHFFFFLMHVSYLQVIARIFFEVNRSSTGKITMAELRRSTFLQVGIAILQAKSLHISLCLLRKLNIFSFITLYGKLETHVYSWVTEPKVKSSKKHFFFVPLISLRTERTICMKNINFVVFFFFQHRDTDFKNSKTCTWIISSFFRNWIH